MYNKSRHHLLKRFQTWMVEKASIDKAKILEERLIV